MSSIASNSEDLILNADGGSSEVKFKIDGTEKASISSAGAFTSTTIDATKLTGNLPAINGSALTNISHNGTFTNDVTVNDSSNTPTINFNESDGTQKMKIGFSTYASDEAEWRIIADKPIKFSNDNTVRLTIAAGGAITNESGVYKLGALTTAGITAGWNFDSSGATNISLTQGSSSAITTSLNGSGMILVNDTSLTGETAIFVTGGGQMDLIGGTSTSFVNSSSPSSSQIGLYVSGGKAYVKNGINGTLSLNMQTFRTRSGQ